MPEYDDDDVEVVYDVPYDSSKQSKQSLGGRGKISGRSNPSNHSGGSSGIIGNYVCLEKKQNRANFLLV